MSLRLQNASGSVRSAGSFDGTPGAGVELLAGVGCAPTFVGGVWASWSEAPPPPPSLPRGELLELRAPSGPLHAGRATRASTNPSDDLRRRVGGFTLGNSPTSSGCLPFGDRANGVEDVAIPLDPV